MNNGKVRIYELSKELSLDNKDILEICEELSISAKSHSSTITEEDATNIRAAATSKSAQKNKTPTSPEKETRNSFRATPSQRRGQKQCRRRQ